MTHPAISIIVPVYKVEKLIRRCVDSILSQSFTEWELILVDDGSPDNSGGICDELAHKDSRIMVLHKPNGGASSARNLGLEHAIGDYIAFIDADDYIRPQFLARMMSQTPADLVICGFDNIGTDGFQPETESICLNGNAASINRLIAIPYYLDTPWCKLFRRKLIVDNNQTFDCGLRLSEDTLFCYKFLYFCETVNVISDRLYFYNGTWGGDSKYELTYDELSYASKCVISALDSLSEKFNTSINTRYKCFHLAKLKGLFEDYKDTDTYQLYLQSHIAISFDDFISDSNLSPLSIGLGRADRLIKQGKIDECIKHLNHLLCFMTKKPSRYASVRQQLFYSVLQNFGVGSALMMLRIINKIRKKSCNE